MPKPKHFLPDTSGVRGSMHGYDSEDEGVTPQNVAALIAEFFDYEDLQLNGATESWPAFWRYVHSSEEFWWNYYCHKQVRVKSQLKGSHPYEVITEWAFPPSDEEPNLDIGKRLSDLRGRGPA